MTDTIPHAPEPDSQTGSLTRRTVLVGATAATAVAAIDAPACAQDADARGDMLAFLLLSAALTGIVEGKLSPDGFNLVLTPPSPAPPEPPSPATVDFKKSDPGSDPVNVRQEYFDWLISHRAKTFRALLQTVRDIGGKALLPADRTKQIIDAAQSPADIKYLARSIVLMWYLGAWHDPDDLRALAEQPNPPPKASKFQIISAKAYTQAWALRVAQAHPMGFSEMQFGYWTRKPQDIASFIGKPLA
jgi:hypothetical protein